MVNIPFKIPEYTVTYHTATQRFHVTGRFEVVVPEYALHPLADPQQAITDRLDRIQFFAEDTRLCQEMLAALRRENEALRARVTVLEAGECDGVPFCR